MLGNRLGALLLQSAWAPVLDSCTCMGGTCVRGVRSTRSTRSTRMLAAAAGSRDAGLLVRWQGTRSWEQEAALQFLELAPVLLAQASAAVDEAA